MTQIKAARHIAPDNPDMSFSSARCSSKPYCYCSLQDICMALHELAGRAALLAPGDAVQHDAPARIRQWCVARERSFDQVVSSLAADPETAALLQDWLAHAPAPLAAAEDGADPYLTLCRDVAALEEHLMLLFGTLMQQGDSAWARRLYRDLLDHRAPVPALALAQRQPAPRPCPPPN